MSDSVSLKEYFERILEEKDKAVNIALAAAKEAVEVAEKNSEKWRDNANEWRQAMNDREAKFITRAEFFAHKESVSKALQVEKERADLDQGKGTGLNQGWVYLVGAVGVVGGLIAIMSRL